MMMKEIGIGQDEKKLLLKSTGFEEYGFIIVEGKKAIGSFFVNSKSEMYAVLKNALEELEND